MKPFTKKPESLQPTTPSPSPLVGSGSIRAPLPSGSTSTGGRPTTLPPTMPPTTALRPSGDSWQLLPPFLKMKAEDQFLDLRAGQIDREYLPAIHDALTFVGNIMLAPSEGSSISRNKVSSCIIKVLISQKSYGAPVEPESLALRKEAFLDILGKYPGGAVERAFTEYCRHHDDVPAPANIRKLVLEDSEYCRWLLRRRNLRTMLENARG